MCKDVGMGTAYVDEGLERSPIDFGQDDRNGLLHGTLSGFSSMYHSCQT